MRRLLKRNATSSAQLHAMLDLIIILVMIGILVSLGAGLYFLIRDGSRSERTVISLSIRVALSVLLLILLAWGLANKFRSDW